VALVMVVLATTVVVGLVAVWIVMVDGMRMVILVKFVQ